MSASHHVFQNLGRRWKEGDPPLVGVSDGACHYGDIDSREFVAVNGEFLRCAV